MTIGPVALSPHSRAARLKPAWRAGKLCERCMPPAIFRNWKRINPAVGIALFRSRTGSMTPRQVGGRKEKRERTEIGFVLTIVVGAAGHNL